jgi:hypothetical protein
MNNTYTINLNEEHLKVINAALLNGPVYGGGSSYGAHQRGDSKTI